ncbi:translation initiation factor IF-2 [Clostridium bornimense]|uniref:translation initiation factor IF-2 n=1 Tax=Clostridium bornimense TaxID=1216932 RepID=UPI001C10F37A|nr:translation initiation factor IF-2 [Clostridium bornimense]MBU5314830.1 translation initiation factor IF-2 [Clostridium bornimense]
MSKVRIYELAKELNVQSKELIELLASEFGIEVKNHMSAIEDEEAELIKDLIEEEKSKKKGKKESLVDEYEEMLNDSIKVKKNRNKNKNKEEAKLTEQENSSGEVVIEMEDTITVKELSELLKMPSIEVIKELMFMGVMAAINAEIDIATVEKLAEKLADRLTVLVVRKEEKAIEKETMEDEDEANLVKRPPVVTVMGHVDHGKTSLLDAIRSAKVTEGEAGGITQHIGAYMAEVNGEMVTFLDTPGHEAFTAMRARGAQVTDIVVLVVAADDGIMPQTKEAINHCKAAEVPIVVAINKIDKPGANIDRVKQELAEEGVLVEDWGGDVASVPVSAKTRQGLDDLLEMILLTSEMLEAKANPNRDAKGTVIEAKLDKGRGAVASLLVQNGTLHVGDSILVGNTYGRIRAMFDHKGKNVKEAGPSVPVEVLGLSEVPVSGDKFEVVKDEKTARNIAEERKEAAKSAYLNTNKVSLEDLYSQIQEGKVKELSIIVKADVQGSVQALTQSLEKLSTDAVKVRVIHGAVGAITETDVTLAAASNAIIIGFNVRPDNNAVAMAEKEKVDMETYRIIYDAIEDVKSAMIGMLEPEYKEVVLGTAEVRQTYKISSVGTVAGCYVTSGKVVRNESVRVVRDGIVIFDGALSSLKRFKDDAKEVAQNYECGLTIDKFNDIKEGDIIEAYTMEEIKPSSL